MRTARLHFWLVVRIGSDVIREFRGSGKFPVVPKVGDLVDWDVPHRVEQVIWSFLDRDDHSLIRADVVLA
jgi:hypothetical protein